MHLGARGAGSFTPSDADPVAGFGKWNGEWKWKGLENGTGGEV